MAVVLTYSAGVPSVKVGRIAGQFAKPRSADTETVDGVELPVVPRPHGQRHRVHRGGPHPRPRAPAARPTTSRASTLNLLRAFTKGGFADLSRVHAWNQEFVALAAARAGATSSWPTRSTGPCGSWRPAASTPSAEPQLHEVDFYTSHEALILGYEEALTRQDSLTGDWYDCSAHMLWIGERTRQLDGAHVEFLSRRRQPDRLQARPDRHPRRGRSPCARRSTPTGCPGRLTLITRMGADHVAERPAAAARGRARRRAPGGVGLRPDARQHLHRRRRPQDPPLRRRSSPRSPGFFAAHRAGGHLARRRPRRAHRRRRHRVPRRRRGDPRRPTSTTATRRCATPASTAASPSTWPSGSPSSCETLIRSRPRRP